MTEDLRDVVRQAGVLPEEPAPLDEVVRRARRLRLRRRVTYVATPVLAALLAVAVIPGLLDQRVELAPVQPGDHAELDLDGTDRIEVRELTARFGQGPVAADGDVVGAVENPEEIARIVRDLQAAHFIDPDDRPAQVPAPDFEVVFWAAGAPVAGLGYYADLQTWGADGVAGRWTSGFIPLTAHAALPEDAITSDSSWVTEQEMREWQADHGEGTWVVGYFFPPDHGYGGGPVFTGLEPRWARVSDDPQAFDGEHHLRMALAELQGTAPADLVHPLEGYSISLREARLDGALLTLDFIPEPWTEAGMGTTGEGAMLSQIATAASHYYPEADELCILLAGEERLLFSHGWDTCPTALPG